MTGEREREREREMFYLTTHSTHIIYGYMASDIWLRTILIVRKETRCRHISYSYRLTARVLLYAPSHRQDNTYHGLCYTSRGALAGARNSSMAPPHEGSIRRPIPPWANALPLSYVPLLMTGVCYKNLLWRCTLKPNWIEKKKKLKKKPTNPNINNTHTFRIRSFRVFTYLCVTAADQYDLVSNGVEHVDGLGEIAITVRD